MGTRIINTKHWTADFQLVRVFWEAYQESPRDGVHVVCLADPGHPLDETTLEIADELSRYHPDVHGGWERPVSADTLRQVTEENRDPWGRALLIAVAGMWAPPQHAGKVLVLSGDRLAAGIRPPDWGRGIAPVDHGSLPDAGSDLEEGSGDGVAVPWPKGAAPAPEEKTEAWVLYPDVAVFPLVAYTEGEGSPVPVAEKDRRKCRDVVIDGLLRLYTRLGHDHVRFQREGNRQRL